MHSSDNARAISPDPPRSRQALGVAASIWAPQPQPSDTTWPRTLDSFSRVAEREFDLRSRLEPVLRREDVFGPVPSAPSRSRDVGAIGDGRKKNSPVFDDSVSCFYLGIFSFPLLMKLFCTAR